MRERQENRRERKVKAVGNWNYKGKERKGPGEAFGDERLGSVLKSEQNGV